MVEGFLCSGCFITCMVAHFATVEMDIEIGFSILSGPFESVKVPVA